MRGPNASIAACAKARWPGRCSAPLPVRRAESCLGLLGVERDGTRRRPRCAFRPFGQSGEEPALGGRGFAKPLGDDRRPGPAQPEQRLRRGPRPLAFRPVASRHVEQLRGRGPQERGDVRVAPWWLEPGLARQSARRRHHEARRAEKGEQFEHVQPRQIGIAEPLPDQRCVEHDHRRVGRDPDRLAPSDRPRALGIGDPDAAMACVQRGIGERSHVYPIARMERIGNGGPSHSGTFHPFPSPASAGKEERRTLFPEKQAMLSLSRHRATAPA